MKKPNGISSIISQGSFINGTITFGGVVIIAGTVKGPSVSTVCAKEASEKKRADAIILSGGHIIAEEVKSNTLYIEDGILQCSIARAEENLFIGETAVIKGGVLYYGHSILIQEGAVLDGCQVKHLSYCSEGEIT